MTHNMIADCDLSPLCLAHSFTEIPLLLSATAQHVNCHTKIWSLIAWLAGGLMNFQSFFPPGLTFERSFEM